MNVEESDDAVAIHTAIIKAIRDAVAHLFHLTGGRPEDVGTDDPDNADRSSSTGS